MLSRIRATPITPVGRTLPRRRIASLALAFVLLSAPAAAHPLAPSLLELVHEVDGVYAVTWKTPLRAPAGRPPEPVLPERCRDRGERTLLREDAAWRAVWRVDCGAASLVGERLAVAGLLAGGAGAVVRWRAPGGVEGQSWVDAAQPGVVIPAVPRRLEVAWRYLRLGVGHLLGGLDHVLFVLGLLVLVRGARPLFATVTAFTLGHSVTLALAATDALPLPARWAEVAIAGTLLLLASEIAAARGAGRVFGARPWRAAAVFGLLHGMGFADALRAVGLPRGEVVPALLAFNVGIELGQLAVVAAGLALFALFGRLEAGVSVRRARTVYAYAFGSLAAYWLFDRVALAFRG